MNDEVLLSVCVITYNQEKFIRQTLDSILLQEHSFSYEILIGDDCSQDKTRNIISEYAEKYPEIIVPIFNEKNLGIVGNYFNVLGHASGKYVMECAGDDWWLPGKVTKQIEFLEQNPEIGMCYGKAKEFLNSKNRFTKKYIGKKCEEFSQLLERNEIPALTVCFRRELANKYFSEINPLEKDWGMEDAPMWLWFSAESKIKFIDSLLGVYRVMDSSGSHFVDVEKFLRFEQSDWDKKNFFSLRYLGKEAEPYNLHPELCMLYLRNNERMLCLNEIKQCDLSLRRNRILLWIISNAFLFKVFRLYKLIKG